MRAITKFLVGGAAMAGLASAAPAAAQYFPGYGSPYGNPYQGYGYGYPGNGYPGGNYGGYGYNVPGGSQVAASQCSAAVQQRLGGYGYENGYGYGNGAAGGRVLGIDSVEIRSGGGYRVRGTAAANGYTYGAVGFSCRTDPRGYVVDVNFNNRQYQNGYEGNGNGDYGSNYDNPYSAYGYQRY